MFDQLGEGAPQVQLTPRSIAGLPDDVTQVAAGQAHSLALRADGTVLAWGNNSFGQLGNGDPSVVNDPTPTPVAGLSGVVQIVAGAVFNVALRSDGTVWAWGINQFGQIGAGAPAVQLTPRQVPGLAGVVEIAAGDGHALALLADGTVRAWGEDAFGQLGDGNPTSAPVPTPVVVSGLSGVAHIAAGAVHSLAVLGDGSVRGWGSNGVGQLGDGTKDDQRDTPIVVPTLNNIVQVDAGSDHSVARRADGTVWAWGFNAQDQVGGPDRFVLTPRQVPELAGVTQIVAGDGHNLAVRADGTLWAWGFNGAGQLGDGTQTSSPTPVQVVGMAHVVNVAGGRGFSLATVATPGFAIALTATSGSVSPGDAATTQVTLTPINGFTGSASLSATGLPAGVTASFSPSSVSAAQPATLTLSTSATSPTGTFPITVTAIENSAPGRVKTATYQLSITAGPAFSITLSPADGFIFPGGSVTTQVSFSPGSTGTATLTATNLPDGTTAAFSSTQISAGSPVTLTLSSEGSPSGDYQVYVTATAVGGTPEATSQTAIFELTILGEPGPGGN